MSHTVHARRWSGAICLSPLSVAAAVAVQGVVFFPRELISLNRQQIIVRQFVAGDEGRAALALVTPVSAMNQVPARQSGHIYDLTVDPPVCRELRFDQAPWQVTCAAHASRGFVSTDEGDLYLVDLTAAAQRPIHLGRHEGGWAKSLGCSADGSRLIVVARDITAWDVESRRLLWRREDLAAEAAAFAPSDRSLFCCLSNGGIVELDAETGAVVRRLSDGSVRCAGIAVSADGRCLAVAKGTRLGLIDLETRICTVLRSHAPAYPAYLYERGTGVAGSQPARWSRCRHSFD